MSNYVVMPKKDWQDILDATRTVSGHTGLLLSSQVSSLILNAGGGSTKTTTVNIYDSLSGNLIKTIRSEASSGITVHVNEIAGDGVSSIFFSETDGDYIDQIDNSDIVVNGSYEYYPSYAGLSLANDNDTNDVGDVHLDTAIDLEPGKEYTYYLLYDGERVTIDGKKYWIPNHNITWSETADNDLIPVFQGNSALACIYKDGVEYSIGDQDYADGTISSSEYKLHTIIDVYTNDYAIGEGDDLFAYWNSVEGTNITWELAIQKMSNENARIEDDQVVIYDNVSGNKYLVTKDNVPVSPTDVIISCYGYIAENISQQIVTTATFYSLPYGGTTYELLGTFKSTSSNPYVRIYDSGPGAASTVDYCGNDINSGTGLDGYYMYNADGEAIINGHPGIGGTIDLVAGNTYTFYLVFSSDEFITPSVVTTVNIAGHELTTTSSNPILAFDGSVGRFALFDGSTANQPLAQYTPSGSYPNTEAIPLLGAPQVDGSGVALTPGQTYYYSYYYDDGSPQFAVMINHNGNITWQTAVAGCFYITWINGGLVEIGGGSDDYYSDTTFIGLSTEDDGNVTTGTKDIPFGTDIDTGHGDGADKRSYIYYLYDENSNTGGGEPTTVTIKYWAPGWGTSESHEYSGNVKVTWGYDNDAGGTGAIFLNGEEVYRGGIYTLAGLSTSADGQVQGDSDIPADKIAILKAGYDYTFYLYGKQDGYFGNGTEQHGNVSGKVVKEYDRLTYQDGYCDLCGHADGNVVTCPICDFRYCTDCDGFECPYCKELEIGSLSDKTTVIIMNADGTERGRMSTGGTSPKIFCDTNDSGRLYITGNGDFADSVDWMDVAINAYYPAGFSVSNDYNITSTGDFTWDEGLNGITLTPGNTYTYYAYSEDDLTGGDDYDPCYELGHDYSGGTCTRCGSVHPDWATCPTCQRLYYTPEGCAYCM
jgi:hypothetical protein